MAVVAVGEFGGDPGPRIGGRAGRLRGEEPARDRGERSGQRGGPVPEFGGAIDGKPELLEEPTAGGEVEHGAERRMVKQQDGPQPESVRGNAHPI